MERYKASIDSVDSALHRLNQTMAAYQISKVKGHEEKSADEQIGTDHRRCDDVRRNIQNLRSTYHYPEETNGTLRLQSLEEALDLVSSDTYNLVKHIFVAIEFLGLGYPDLATGSAYKALLLSDALDDEAEEYHNEALEALAEVIAKHPLQERIQLLRKVMNAKDEDAWGDEPEPELDIEIFHWLEVHYRLIIYRVFIRSLIECGSFRSAHSYVVQALRLYPKDVEILSLQAELHKIVESNVNDPEIVGNPSEWPDKGFVRREIYPWNHHEPDRLNELSTLNEMMQEVAPKLEVRAVNLPALSSTSDDTTSTITQLGVFAKEALLPSQIILDETSLLTANNKLQDALCDACSSDLPDLSDHHSSSTSTAVSCPECDVIFCSETCLSQAETTYHPALCDKDVEAIAKDVPPSEAADALYSLLLLRAFAMSETQSLHPLDLREVKYIWGDFDPTVTPNPTSPSPSAFPTSFRRSLPFSFDHNIRLPFHMLEKMDLDIFAHPAAEVWVFNTLYSKFRGTASARLSGKGGGPVRGPEVGAVHPMWCLANHSCDPNVGWDWGGSVRFEVRRERVGWKRGGVDGKEGEGEEEKRESEVGIEKDEEILNHYCDVDLTVGDRREWARGALGGDCRCERCKWEARETS